jgi:hypothetical protein
MYSRSKPLVVILSVAAILGGAASSSAQQTGLVNVDLRNARILNNVANDLNVNVSNIPITVQAPINIAANVCQVSVAVLARAIQRDGASCYAQQTSRALNRIVRNVMAVNQE